MIFLNISGDFAYNETLVNVAYLISQTLGTLLNCFTVFMVCKYSTPDMKDYKLHLLMYQLGSGSLDFCIDFIASPVFFFPYIAGTSQGIFHKVFGMDTFLVAVRSIIRCEWVSDNHFYLSYLCITLYRCQSIIISLANHFTRQFLDENEGLIGKEISDWF